MDALSYEAQTALVSFLAALGVGGLVTLLGARFVADAARQALVFAVRRRMMLSAGATAITCLGALGLHLNGGESEPALALFSIFG